MSLSDKITSAEQFDSTPAGKALKEYSHAFALALRLEENPDADDDSRSARARWDAAKLAERALIEEIKRLQSNTLRKRPIAFLRYRAAADPVQFQYRSDAGDPPEDEGWIALYRRGQS